ncbi:hypothetical protein ACP4OV_007868 [Aristida adscensionis]
MGSLMAGWSSPVLAGDKNKVRLMRNRSLTNEEIEAFWRQHGRPASAGDSTLACGSHRAAGADVDSPLSSPSPRRRPEETPFTAGGRLEAVRSLPSPLPPRGAGTTGGVQWPPWSHGQHHVSARSEPPSPATTRATTAGFFPEEDAAGSPSTSRDWWMRSSWAFLNEARAPQAEAEEARMVSGRAQQRRYTYDDQFVAARIVTGNA